MGISEIEFTGATGKVKFKESKKYYKNRDRRLFTYGLYNVQEVRGDEGNSLEYILTDILTEGGAEEGIWKETTNGPFIFATGTPNPPKLLRADPEQNYLSRGSHITGLVLMSIALATITAAVVFIAWKANHSVVRNAQPFFLYAFAFGATTMATAIFTLSWDESYGWNADMLTAACQATPWLVVLGHVIIYCSIFSKLWRLNQVLQFRRRTKVNVKQVLGPFVAMVIFAIIVLSVWTALDPLTWKRRVIDDFTGETFGACRSDHSVAFLIPLACIMVLSTTLAAFMAWKTKDVQSRFSESTWIFYTIFVQLQTLLVGIPVIVILYDESTNAAYLGRVMVIWTIPMTTVLLLIGPKAALVFFPKKENSKNRSRGVSMAPGGLTVSGLSPSAAQSFARNSSAVSGGGSRFSSTFRSQRNGSMNHSVSSHNVAERNGSMDLTVSSHHVAKRNTSMGYSVSSCNAATVTNTSSVPSEAERKTSVTFQLDARDQPREEVTQDYHADKSETATEEQFAFKVGQNDNEVIAPEPNRDNETEEFKDEVQ